MKWKGGYKHKVNRQAGRQDQAVMSVRRKVISGVNDGRAGTAAANIGGL